MHIFGLLGSLMFLVGFFAVITVLIMKLGSCNYGIGSTVFLHGLHRRNDNTQLSRAQQLSHC